MPTKSKHIYVAYIGTTKVAFLKANILAPERSEVVSLSARLAHGFERGVVKDLASAHQTLADTIHDVVRERDENIIPCRVVVSNAYFKNYTFQSSVYFQDRPHALTMKDVRSAIAQTRSVATIPLQEIIVQTIPQSFLVNDLDGIQNPLGLEAGRIGVTLRLLTLDFLVHSNLMKVFERCELEVIDFIPSILSAAQLVLKPSEKQEGCILVVIGGRATHFACYKGAVLVETISIPFGADLITDVIAQKLNVDFLDAQRIKETFGAATPKTEFQDELIPIMDSNGQTKYHISRAEFEAHMGSGIHHFFDEIRKTVKALQDKYAPLTQLIYTGGGVKLDGFLDVAKETISPISRLGSAQGILGPESLIANPAFSGILGGVQFTSRVSEGETVVSTPQNWISRTVEAARNWIFEYF